MAFPDLKTILEILEHSETNQILQNIDTSKQKLPIFLRIDTESLTKHRDRQKDTNWMNNTTWEESNKQWLASTDLMASKRLNKAGVDRKEEDGYLDARLRPINKIRTRLHSKEIGRDKYSASMADLKDTTAT